MTKSFLIVDPEVDHAVLKGIASPARATILKRLHERGPMNVNELAAELQQPQSTISTHIQILEEAGLVESETQKARKGNQKICRATVEEVIVVSRARCASRARI